MDSVRVGFSGGITRFHLARLDARNHDQTLTLANFFLRPSNKLTDMIVIDPTRSSHSISRIESRTRPRHRPRPRHQVRAAACRLGRASDAYIITRLGRATGLRLQRIDQLGLSTYSVSTYAYASGSSQLGTWAELRHEGSVVVARALSFRSSFSL